MKIPHNDIENLNLNCVINRLSKEQKPKSICGGWSVKEARAVALAYKKFLYICYKYPKEKLVPFKELDEFWHNHILFTKKYTKDCERIFGQYLHHHPDDDKQSFDKSFYEKQFNRTKELILKEFPPR